MKRAWILMMMLLGCSTSSAEGTKSAEKWLSINKVEGTVGGCTDVLWSDNQSCDIIQNGHRAYSLSCSRDSCTISYENTVKTLPTSSAESK
jgi:hypothetical protein